MTDTPLTPPASGAPIDAEFEPARPKPEVATPPAHRSGPGWFAVSLVGLAAIASLAVSGVLAGILPGFKLAEPDLSQFSAEIERLDQAALNEQDARALISEGTESLSSRIDGLQADQTRLRVQVQEVSDLLDQLETNVIELRPGALNGQALSPAGSEADTSLIKAMQARIEALEAAPVPSSDRSPATATPDRLAELQTEINELRERLSDLETELREQAGPAVDPASVQMAEAALALSAIEAAARRGQPFLSAYQRLNAALPNNGAVATLEPLSRAPVSTLADLRAAFPALSEDVLQRDATSAADGSALMRQIFGDGIRVRRSGEISTRDRLSEASAALEAGRLDNALDQIEALDPDLQTVFTDWGDSARDRLELEGALEALRLTMIAKDRP